MSETVLSKSDLQKLDDTISGYISKKMVPSLSALLNEKINFSSTKTRELSFENMSDIIPHSNIDSQDVGVYVTCNGEIKFGILFHFTLTDAKKLASKLMCSDEFKEMREKTINNNAIKQQVLPKELFMVTSRTKTKWLQRPMIWRARWYLII